MRHRYVKIIFSLILLFAVGVQADVWSTSVISTNTTWAKNNGTGDGVYVVDVANDTLIVASGVRLTIEPGVTVKFHDDIIFLVYGELDASGTSSDSIIFMSDDAAGSAGEWGGIKLESSTGAVNKLLYCRIQDGDADNTATGAADDSKNGGAIYFAVNIDQNTQVMHSTIQNNSAIEGGGGIYCAGSPQIEANLIRNNSAGQYGGGIALKGTSLSQLSSPVIRNNIITNNSANGQGGGGVFFFANINDTLYNNTIVSNSSPNGSGGGIHVYSSSAFVRIVNALIGGNSANSDDQVFGVADIVYSDVQGGYSGEGNIDEDPHFLDETNGDYHVAATSPIVDAGSNDGAPATDFDGNARPFDGDRNSVATADMGAYEYQNTAPQITSTPLTEATEDQLYSYTVVAEDPDSAETLTYTLVEGPSFLAINASSGVLSGTPQTDADAGDHTVTVQVADLNNATDTQTYTLHVTAVNDAPVVSGIPDQTIDEGQTFATINLDDYVTDEDNSDAEMTWTYSGNLQLAVSIDANHVATITTPDSNWYGSETITFTAKDPGGLTGSDAAVFTVNNINDAPVVSDIPDQTVDEGQTFTTINLDDYVTDIDNVKADLTWTYSGNSELSVSIDANHVATISIPNEDWYGGETITFKATDPGGLADSDAAVFTVNAVNDAPVVSDIPGQTIDEGQSFVSIALDDYVSDVDNTDAEMTWTYSGNTDLQVTISADHVATVFIPNEDWFGSETITFTATDPGGLSGSDSAVFTVNNINDAPVAVNDTSATNEDTALTLHVLSNDSDVDGDNLTVQSVTAPTHGTATIIQDSLVIYTPEADWSGSDQFTYTASDGNGGTASATVYITVNAVNDAPVVADIPDQSIQEGQSFVSIALDDYVSDVDNSDAEMTWSYTGNSELSVSIDANHVATVSIPDSNWYGQETITFRATDPAGLYDENAAQFTVSNVNDAPVVSAIPNQTIEEGQSFATIALDDYVSDVDNSDAEMIWSYTGNSELSVSIDANRIATITTPNADWNGAENITFTATDPSGLADSTAAAFTVSAVNDAPVVSDIPDQSIEEGQQFTTIALDGYVSDVDNSDAEIIWTYSGNSDLHVSIDTNRTATVSIPDANWNGSETITFRATDNGGLFDEDAATFTVTAINDAPAVSDIPDQTIAEGAAFAVIQLDDYVDDPDNADADISWTVSGQSALTINYDEINRTVTVSVPDSNWNGSETLVFTAADPAGLTDADSAVFTVTPVNDAPVMTQIPAQNIYEGEQFPVILLDDFVSDVDDSTNTLIWEVTGNTELIVTVDSNRVLQVLPPSEDWNGSETLLFTVSDPQGLSDSSRTEFTVTAVNDAPQFTAQVPAIFFAEDDSLHYAKAAWWPFVEDKDNADSTLILTAFTGKHVTVRQTTDSCMFKAPQNWFGVDTLLLTVSDGELFDSTYFVVDVKAVNDAPVISNLPEQITFENDSNYVLTMKNFAGDVDTPDSLLSWSFVADNDSLLMQYDAQSTELTLSAPGFKGDVTLICTVRDDSSASAVDTITVHVDWATGIGDDLAATLPDKFSLGQNYPNPFNPSTHIGYALPKTARVQLIIYNVLGQKVRTLVDKQQSAGRYQMQWRGLDDAGRQVASGVYIYLIRAGAFVKAHKMILMR